MSLHDQIPYEYRQALHSTDKAKTMVMYLLLDQNESIKVQQQDWMTKQRGICQDYYQTLLLMSDELPSRLVLPLVELIMPLLKTLSDQSKKDLLKQVLYLAKWNGKFSTFEICLYSLLRMSFEKTEIRGMSHTIKNFTVVLMDINRVLSSLIHASGGTDEDKEILHKRMIRVLTKQSLNLLTEQEVNSKALFTSLKKLKHLSPMLKRSLIDVCGDIVLHNGIIQSGEYETLRLVSLLLACPMPVMEFK